MNFIKNINILMILLCTILKVVNGKSFFEVWHHSTDGNWPSGEIEGVKKHSRTIRHAGPGILDIRMTCPSGMRYVRKRCRKILTEFGSS